jgi:hypothetical protein
MVAAVLVSVVLFANGERYQVGQGAPDNPITRMLLHDGVIEIFMLKSGEAVPAVFVWPSPGMHVFTESGTDGPKPGSS